MKLPYHACFHLSHRPKLIIQVLFLLAALTCTTAMSCAQETKVTVYSDDFKGSEATFGVGKHDYFTLVRAGISVIRSVRVPEGLKVTLYQEDNFKGKQLVLTEDANQKYISAKGFGQLQHNVSMVVVSAPIDETVAKVTLYKDNFSGEAKSLAPGYYEFADFGNIDNDQLSSVTIPKGLKVTLYENSGFTGRKLELTTDTNASELMKNKFNDVTSSLRVETVEEPKIEPVVVVVPAVITTETKPVQETPIETTEPQLAVHIYQGNFSGTSKVCIPGKYNVADLGIGNDELSSVDIPAELRVTLYEKEGFKGRSLRLTSRAGTEQLTEQGFNNLTSSLIVEVVPKVSVYQGNFTDFAFRFSAGKYDILELERMGLMEDEVSSVKVPAGMSVLLFEDPGFKGRALYLTHDFSTDSLISKKFNNVTSSIQVNEEEAPEVPELKVTVYQDNFTGISKQLSAGQYDHTELGIGNNTLSAISIPRGLRVTLYEHGALEGKSLTLVKSAGPDLLNQYQFNDAATSMKVEEIDPKELVVTIYSDQYSGRGQQLAPGKYYARDLTIGDKQLTSVTVPKGMRATLYADWNCQGVSVMLDRDEDFTGSKLFDNYYRSIMVEDIANPVVQGVPVVVTAPVATETPALVEQPKTETTTPAQSTYSYEPPCELNEEDYEDALKAVRAKPFSEEKMAMARLVTKEKCLTHEQIRSFAREFSFEEQSLEFVEYAYALAKDKEKYYKLEDVFKFMSTQEKFRKFLQSK